MTSSERWFTRSLWLLLLSLASVSAFAVDCNTAGFACTNLDTQIKGSRLPMWGTDSGSANAYAITTVAPLGPSLRTGSRFMFIATHANTSASTLAIDGGSATAIKKNVSTALASGDIALNQVIEVTYDGTNFQLVGNGPLSFSNITGSLACSQMPAGTGDVTWPSGSCATTLATVVTAGTCGDGTHSCGLTYDAKGRITAATNNAITGGGGGGGGDYSSLASSITCTNCTVSSGKILPNASVASFTVSSIPGTFVNLKVTCATQTTSGTFQGLRMRFNSDSGSNYFWQIVGSGGSSTTDTSILLGWGGQTSLTNRFVTSMADVFQYASTSMYKSQNGLVFLNAQPGVYAVGGYWSNTAAITSITFLLDAGNFGSNSVCTLDGYN